MGCSTNSNEGATSSIFATKEEAENAAKYFNCEGAHQMGSKWMPCDSHEFHQQNKKDNGNAHHHHH